MSKSYEHACAAWNLNIPKFEIDLHAGSEPSQLIISFLGILSSIFTLIWIQLALFVSICLFQVFLKHEYAAPGPWFKP